MRPSLIGLTPLVIACVAAAASSAFCAVSAAHAFGLEDGAGAFCGLHGHAFALGCPHCVATLAALLASLSVVLAGAARSRLAAQGISLRAAT